MLLPDDVATLVRDGPSPTHLPHPLGDLTRSALLRECHITPVASGWYTDVEAEAGGVGGDKAGGSRGLDQLRCDVESCGSGGGMSRSACDTIYFIYTVLLMKH